MKFIHEDFLLHTRRAARLYHQYAEAEPIFDYHCHLSPRDIAANRQFKDLFEIWLEGDHYKWRAMRANGVEERYCTGAAKPFEKFQAWAATVPHTLRNPLYHWTHLELKRYFGIDELLDEESAARIWKKAGERLATPEFSAQGILKRFKVAALCTTDDPTDSLEHHHALAFGEGGEGGRQLRLELVLLRYGTGVDQPRLAAPRPALPDPVEVPGYVLDLGETVPVLPGVGEGLSDGLGAPFGAVGGREGAPELRFGRGHESDKFLDLPLRVQTAPSPRRSTVRRALLRGRGPSRRPA